MKKDDQKRKREKVVEMGGDREGEYRCIGASEERRRYGTGRKG